MKTTLTRQQKWLIDQMNEALNHHLYQKIEWKTGVYFDADAMEYLYIDRYMSYDEIRALVNSGTLVFVGLKQHQGINMMRYELNKTVFVLDED